MRIKKVDENFILDPRVQAILDYDTQESYDEAGIKRPNRYIEMLKRLIEISKTADEYNDSLESIFNRYIGDVGKVEISVEEMEMAAAETRDIYDDLRGYSEDVKHDLDKAKKVYSEVPNNTTSAITNQAYINERDMLYVIDNAKKLYSDLVFIKNNGFAKWATHEAMQNLNTSQSIVRADDKFGVRFRKVASLATMLTALTMAGVLPHSNSIEDGNDIQIEVEMDADMQMDIGGSAGVDFEFQGASDVDMTTDAELRAQNRNGQNQARPGQRAGQGRTSRRGNLVQNVMNRIGFVKKDDERER